MVIMTPVIIIYVAALMQGASNEPDTIFLKTLNNLGFIWILSIAYFFLTLLFYGTFRESILSALAGFKERDEREQLVTAKAARATFLFMLAVQLVMLIMTFTSIHLLRTPDGHGTLTVGMHIDTALHGNLLNGADISPSNTQVPETTDIHRYLLPPNFAGILLFLILAQIITFKLVSHKYYAE